MDIRMYGIFFLMDIRVAIRKVGGLFPKEKMKFRVNCFLQFDGRVGRNK